MEDKSEPKAVPTPDEVLAALSRLLAWQELARSPQLARFLDYIVRRTVDGETNAIKAYAIAVDVLGRPSDFDPQSDPIVRVQARRLRSLLSQYYGGVGADDPVRISLPVGRYVPTFASRPLSPDLDDQPVMSSPGQRQPAPVGHVSLSWFALLAITLGTGVLAFSLSTWEPGQPSVPPSWDLISRPSLTITEFQNLTGDESKLPLAAGLAIELVTDLEQFETIDVRYGGGSESSPTDVAGDFVLSGIVRRESAQLQYSAILTDLTSRVVVWNRSVSLDVAAATDPAILDIVSGLFSKVLGSPRGPLHQEAIQLLASGVSIEGGENLYLCRISFELYRARSSDASAARATACFEALTRREPASGQAMAAMASLAIETATDRGVTESAWDERVMLADQLLTDALRAAPVSGFVWEQKARFEEARGRHSAAEAAYISALQLNPASTDAVAARARHLAFMGRLDEAVQLSRRAIDGAPEVPAWYLSVPALESLQSGQYSAAIEYAEIYTQADRELGPVLAIMAAQGSGDSEIINRYLPRVLEVPSFRAAGVLTQLGRRIVDDALLQRVRLALTEAGVPEAALTQAF